MKIKIIITAFYISQKERIDNIIVFYNLNYQHVFYFSLTNTNVISYHKTIFM